LGLTDVDASNPQPGLSSAGTAGPKSGPTGAGMREVFFFCGDQRRDELPEKLQQAGIGVRELVVYRTRQTPHHLEKGYEGIVFFSPSAVHSFFSLNKAPAATVLFAIGRTTAEAIRQYSANPMICGVSPEKDALIRLAMNHFRGRMED
jgi:uroporphyrinogen-III synthase